MPMLPILVQVFLALWTSNLALAAAPTHYEVLGLPRDASQADVKKTYKQLARQYHPDKNPAEDAQKRFIEIQKAYEVLSDPAQRRKYDSSSGFWSDEEDSSNQDRYDGPPDGGRGVVLENMEVLRQAVQGDELWLLHVYTDHQELFGSWMVELPEDMRLGHVNVERDEEMLRGIGRILGGRLQTAPILVLCQHGRHRAFAPDFQSIFFGVESAVMREALHFVDYSREVTSLYSDDALGSFLEFQPGGSSRLRLLFILERSHERHYDIYSACMRLRGLASIAQLGYYDTGMHGRPGRLNEFGLRQLPSVIISDPLTGGFELMTGRRAIESASEVVQKMLNGQRVSTRMYPIQELDLDTYAHRCGAASEKCDWLVVFASSASLEKQPEDLHRTSKVFTKACETLDNAKKRLPSSFACFWLRLGRAPAWDKWLQQHSKDTSGPISHAVFVVSKLVTGSSGVPILPMTVQLRVAPDAVSASSTGQWNGLFKWCTSAMIHNSQSDASLIEEWPDIPVALTSQEELHEPSEVQTPMRQLQLKIEEFQEIVSVLLEDPDVGVILIGLCVGIVLLCLGVLAFSCQTTEQKSLEDSLSKLEPWILVRLSRDDATSKWGFGIAQADNGRIRITNIFEGGLLEAWNAAETQAERRVKTGDDISAVRFDGKTVTSIKEMAEGLKSAKEVSLTIILNPNDDITQRVCRLTGGAILQGLTLGECAELRGRADGFGSDLEIVSLHEPLLAWNAFQRQLGASYTTCFDVGDRVVAINGNADVKAQMEVQSPAVIIVKWRSPMALRANRFDVDLERTDLNESWGYQLRMYPGDVPNTHVMTVARINNDGLLSRWNDTVCASSTNGRPVRIGDRLVKVNGKEGIEAIRIELRKAKVTLCFEYWSGDVIGESEVRKTMQNGIDTKPAEIERRPTPHNGSRMPVSRDSHADTTSTFLPNAATAGLHLNSSSAEVNGWEVDLDNLLEDTSLQSNTSVDNVEVASPQLVSSGVPSCDQNGHSSLPKPMEELLISSSKESSAVMSPRLRKLDLESLRLQGNGLVVLCSSGSEDFIGGLMQFADVFCAGQHPVTFCHEARMPMESLLVIFPRHCLCRLLHRQDSIKRGADFLLEAGSIIWQTLAGDVGLLKQVFDPLKIIECSSLWSAELELQS